MTTPPPPPRRPTGAHALRLPRVAGLAVALLLATPATPALPAEPAAPLDKMIQDLGYEVTPANKDTWASFDADGYVIAFALSTDDTVGILSIAYDVAPEQRGKLPARQLLLANSGLTSAFRVSGTAAGADSVSLARYVLVAGLTPVGLRQQVDALIANAKENDRLLNPENWK